MGEVRESTARLPVLQKWPLHRWTWGWVVPGPRKGEHARLLGSAHLKPAQRKHRVWLRTEQRSSRHGPRAPWVLPRAPAPFRALPQVTPLAVAEEHRVILVVPTVHLLKAKLVFIALHFKRLAVL